MGNHPCEKFPLENYNEEDARRRSESSMALEEEVKIVYKKGPRRQLRIYEDKQR